jgi:hypothetical protein
MLDTPPLTRLVVASAVLGAAAGAATLQNSRTADVGQITLTAAPAEPSDAPILTAAREAPAPVADPSEVFLVFRAADHTYMQLDEAVVPHGAPHLSHSDDDALYASIAPLVRVPASIAAWQGKHVTVDGTCEATVEGFAIVSRLTGDTGYAGLEATDWTAKNVMTAGTPVLAARLSGCTGTYAREAALPPIVTLVDDTSDRADLAELARERVLGSDAAAAVQTEWAQQQAAWPDDDRSATWASSPSSTIETRILRHPTTGVTWIAVHASREDGCGGVNANVFGLFRVRADNTLETVTLRDLGDLHTVTSLVDIDGDGTPELLGNDWLQLDTLITRATGETMTSSHVQFFGCPC